VPLAFAVSHAAFRQTASGREIAGMGLIVIGVALLLLAQ
jgi:multidrug transporter EmrE-like cation transporter